MRKIMFTATLLLTTILCKGFGRSYYAPVFCTNIVEAHDITAFALADEPVAELIAYYAKEAFGDYEEGELIVDTNDPINRIVPHSATEWKYEGDDTGEYYSSIIPKSKVEVKKYTMYPLPAKEVKSGITFMSDDGKEARIFLSNINGHKFFSWDGTEEMTEETSLHKQCYVLTMSIDDECFFEEQIDVEDGNLKLYCENRFADLDNEEDCRFRAHKIGLIEEQWYNATSYPDDKSAYAPNGNLLVDQWEVDGIADYISIAYLPNENALYIDGTLYFRQSE